MIVIEGQIEENASHVFIDTRCRNYFQFFFFSLVQFLEIVYSSRKYATS